MEAVAPGLWDKERLQPIRLVADVGVGVPPDERELVSRAMSVGGEVELRDIREAVFSDNVTRSIIAESYLEENYGADVSKVRRHIIWKDGRTDPIYSRNGLYFVTLEVVPVPSVSYTVFVLHWGCTLSYTVPLPRIDPAELPGIRLHFSALGGLLVAFVPGHVVQLVDETVGNKLVRTHLEAVAVAHRRHMPRDLIA